MKCSCVCTIENHNDYKITYDIKVLNQDSFVKFMHMAASVTLFTLHCYRIRVGLGIP